MLKTVVNKVRKLPVLAGKKRKSRRVLGFWCDPGLSFRVKALAEAVRVPVYVLAEHLLQLGLAHIARDVEGDVNNSVAVGDPFKELHDHLLHQHLLVDKLGHEEYDLRVIARHAELTLEQGEQVKAVIDLVKRLGAKGITHDIVIDTMERLATQLQREQRIRQTKRELQGEVDLQLLQEINRRFPKLIPELQKVMNRYPAEDLSDLLK